MNIASAVKEPALQADFFDEKGLLKEYQLKSMYVLSGTSSDKPIMIEFGCGLTPLSFDRKLTLQADTGADMNAINKRTFNEVLPDVELEESTQIVQNFDKRLIKPIGSFRCFLRMKDHKYRVKFEVMGMARFPESSSDHVVGSNNHSLSITDLPLMQEKVESTYADIFKSLGKFPGEPYKLRLKPDAVPAKHRPRKVPVHL